MTDEGVHKEQCCYCGGSLQPEILNRYDVAWLNQTYRFEAVPALVCAACGEVFLEAAVDQAIDRAIEDQSAPKRFDQIPVLDLAV